MKYKIALAIVSLLFISLAYSQKKGDTGKKTFELKGDIAGLKSPQIMIAYDVDGKTKFDTVNVINGKFVFTGSLAGPRYSRMMSTDGSFMNNQYLENMKMTITRKDSVSEVVFSGSATEDENAAYKKLLAPLQKQGNALAQELNTLSETDSVTAARRMKEELTPMREKFFAIMKQYIREHPGSLVALGELANLSNIMETKELQSYYLGFDKPLQESYLGKRIRDQVAAGLKTETGVSAMEFTQKSITGDSISLASYRGKYVLIDFWASWCGPCRAENPNLLKAFKKYKDKGFDILGVSMDQDGAKWKEAVEKDQLPWTQVSDLKGSENAAASKYGVTAIPANFLIDPKGFIIAKNLRGEDLEKKLAEIFAN